MIASRSNALKLSPAAVPSTLAPSSTRLDPGLCITGDSEVIEDALRRALGLDALDELWANVTPLREEQAMALALEAQRFARRKKR